MILESTIRLPFSYAAGTVGSRFLIALREDQKILGARCTSCSTVTAPPRPFCSSCSRTVTELVEVGPDGTLEAWTNQPGNGVFGLILLDGADTPIVHRILGTINPGTVNAEAINMTPGARVTAMFAKDRTGRITDIEGFIVEQDDP
ncbi:MAG: zinc ribbon domain-containing protein [Acidimicrobiia bacterium]|nr:zinc ribbon domain-containing protein [Acidimicrobiia bacterium]